MNASDLALLKRILAKLIELDDPSVVNPDIDGVGTVPNFRDLAFLRNILAGLV